MQVEMLSIKFSPEELIAFLVLLVEHERLPLPTLLKIKTFLNWKLQLPYKF